MKTESKNTPKALTTNERQRKRRQQLNEIAQRHGYDTWTKLETAAINGDILGDDDE